MALFNRPKAFNSSYKESICGLTIFGGSGNNCYMFPYEFYSFLHIFSVIVVFFSLGALVIQIIQGKTKSTVEGRKCLAYHHGIGLLVIFITGFGLMARGGFSLGENYWIFIKIFCWLVIGAFPAFAYKRRIPANAQWWVVLSVLALALFAVTIKPF